MWKSKTIKLALVSLVILTMLLAGGCFNKSPEITSLTPSATSLAPNASCTVSCVASDPDTDDTLTYAWSVTGGAISGTGDTVTWTAPATLGTYTITVSISDGEAAAVSESCEIEVVNTTPTIVSLNPSTTELPPAGSCTISCIANDADGDTLTYTWAATGASITGTGDSVIWTAPATEGTYTVTVEVSDGHGGTASESCDIVVEMKYGSIDVQSNPTGAAVFLNGVDTGNITPYVITNLTPGSYTVELRLYHYKYRQAAVTVNPNETTYVNWSLTYAPEQTLTLQPDGTVGKDSFVSEQDITNLGDATSLSAGSDDAGIYRAYLQFNLDLIPEDVVIANARLGLLYNFINTMDTTEMGAYNVLEAWLEDVIVWSDQPDFATEAEYVANMPATYSGDFIYWYITDLVKGWCDGSITNYGVVLKAANESIEDGRLGFYSSDSCVATERPKLVINYFDPTS